MTKRKHLSEMCFLLIKKGYKIEIFWSNMKIIKEYDTYFTYDLI